MKKSYLSGRFAYKTDIGRVRMTNEDQALALTDVKGNVLLLVADGMGGQNKGDYASSLTIQIISEAFLKRNGIFLSRGHALYWLSKIIRNANAKVYDEASKNRVYQGMGTTLTAVLLVKNFMVVGQVGDSRLYSYGLNGFLQVTEDQTFVQYLYRTGRIKKEEIATHPKRHVLMNALGVYPSLNLDIKIHPYKNETLLVCSDGLYNNVNENTISSILKGDDTVEQKITELISIGNSNGGSDNIGLVLWEAND